MKMKTADLEKLDDRSWSLNGIKFKPVDGRFPDYRRIIPSGFSNEAAQFNPELILQMSKIGKSLGLKGLKGLPIIRHYGDNGAIVHFYNYDDFVGVVMPFRVFNEKNPDFGFPTWGPNPLTAGDCDLI